MLDKVTASTPLNDGIEIRSGSAVIQITALRDDLLRVRAGAWGKLPEDASWAVLPVTRMSSVPVLDEGTATTVGFRTKLLRVLVERATLRIKIADLEGHTIQETAAGRPIEFHGTAFRIYKDLPADEHFFGLGDKPGPLDRRGGAYSMWNTDAFSFQATSDQIYKSIPFFLSFGRGIVSGTFFDNHWRTSFDFGKESHTAYSFGAENGPLDYYVLYGPSTAHVLESYVWLTGTTPLPPLWSLGFQQSRFSYYPESRVMEIADHLRKDRIPSDAIYLDIDYQDRYRPFTIDTKSFPHFGQMIDDLHKQNFHIVAITDLHIADLPDAHYAPFDTGIAGDHFVKNPDGSVYVGKVWPGPAVFPDFASQSTREWWGTLYKQFVKMGIDGFWNDMNEPSVFDSPTKTIRADALHQIDEPGFEKRVATHAEMHNVMGMENSRATYEGLLKLQPNTRPFVLTRASYAGGQRYAATWTGDNSSTWDHLRLTTPTLLNLGMSGFGMSGADVGGFIGTPQPDLLTRWVELGAFQPIDRDHTNKGTGDQEVWVHGPAQEAIRRRYIEERYRLMPYLYTAVEEMSRTGMPILRPLFMEFPDATPDRHPIDLDAGGEFLFGRNILVAPAPFPDELDDYTALLPSVSWYNYWTGEKIPQTITKNTKTQQLEDPPTEITIKPQLAVLPVFVREGSIIPMQPLVQSTNEVPHGPLTLRVYPGQDCHGSIYLDDGKSFAYRHGAFLRMEFSCDEQGRELTVHLGPHAGDYAAWWKNVQVEVYGLTKPFVTAKVDHAVIHLQPSFDKERHVAAVVIPDDGRGTDLRIELAK